MKFFLHKLQLPLTVDSYSNYFNTFIEKTYHKVNKISNTFILAFK